MAFDLSSIGRTKQMRPPRLVIYGEHKVGKSTFAASAPNPIFIQTEDGLDCLDVNAFPLAQNYNQVKEAINTLIKEAHEFQTCVIDSLDWLEDLIHAQVAKDNGKTSIEDFGYGKGFAIAMEYWQEFYDLLNQLRAKGMAIILIAHEHVKKFDNPAVGQSYDRYQLKMRDKAADKAQEWADAIGFAAIKVIVNQVASGFNQTKGFANPTTGSQRVLHLQESPAFVAGNRYNMPAEIPLSWNEFLNAYTNAFNAQ